MSEKKQNNTSQRPSREVVYVLDVPRSYFETCLHEAKSTEEKRELKEILKTTEKDK
jgi:hypothetical protein